MSNWAHTNDKGYVMTAWPLCAQREAADNAKTSGNKGSFRPVARLNNWGGGWKQIVKQNYPHPSSFNKHTD